MNYGNVHLVVSGSALAWMAFVQIAHTWGLFGHLHLINRFFTNSFLNGPMSQVVRISLLIAALLATLTG